MKNKEIKYFPHDVDTRSDIKIIKLLAKHGKVGYSLWWMLLEMLYKSDGYKLPLDYEMLGACLADEADVIRSVVEDFGLFVLDEKKGFFYSKSAKERVRKMDKRIKDAKRAAEARWSKEKQRGVMSQSEAISYHKSQQSTREAERMKSVYGEEVEQDPLRNKTTKYEV